MSATPSEMHEKIGPSSRAHHPAPVRSRVCEVTRTYLEMATLQQLVPGQSPDVPVSLEPIAPCPVDTWRALYRQVGAAWHWHDRDAWEQSALVAHLARPEIHIFRVVAALDPSWTAAAGFLELEQHDDGSVEIAYIGLDPRALGRRLGSWLVTTAVQTAFALGANRVWLHTCTLDAPAALPNYVRRGFSITRTEMYETSIRLDEPAGMPSSTTMST